MAKSDQPISPLRKRTMTLSALQLKTLNLIRLCRFQLRRAAHDVGMGDEEFIETELEPLETEI